MPKKLNLATYNKKMESISKKQSSKIIGGAVSCDDMCDYLTPKDDPGNGEIYQNGGNVMMNPPKD